MKTCSHMQFKIMITCEYLNLTTFFLLFYCALLICYINTTIDPICKNKNGNMSDTSNYRPVAVATVVSKLLEHFILSNISPFLGTTDNHFGFKAGHTGCL